MDEQETKIFVESINVVDHQDKVLMINVVDHLDKVLMINTQEESQQTLTLKNIAKEYVLTKLKNYDAERKIVEDQYLQEIQQISNEITRLMKDEDHVAAFEKVYLDELHNYLTNNKVKKYFVLTSGFHTEDFMTRQLEYFEGKMNELRKKMKYPKCTHHEPYNDFIDKFIAFLFGDDCEKCKIARQQRNKFIRDNMLDTTPHIYQYWTMKRHNGGHDIEESIKRYHETYRNKILEELHLTNDVQVSSSIHFNNCYYKDRLCFLMTITFHTTFK